MKAFINNILKFCLRFLIIVIILSLIISNYDNIDKHKSENSNILSLQTKSHFDGIDILFVGNSFCYSSIQPSMMDNVGISSYNFGIASAGVEFYELMINDYLNNTANYPKTIFLLVSPITFSSLSDNYFAFPIHRYLEDPLTHLDIAMKYNKSIQLLMLYKKSVEKGFLNLTQKMNNNSLNLLYNARGFIKNPTIVTDSIIEHDQYLYYPLMDNLFDPKKIIQLKKMVNTIESKSIDVVYLELPTHKLEDYFNQSYLIDYENAIQSISTDNKILRVSDTLFTSNNFRNIDHLNTSGSVIATQTIINYLLQSPKKSN